MSSSTLSSAGSRKAPLVELLERSWEGRGRAIEGRELRVELLMNAAFGAAVVALLALAPWGDVHPAAYVLVLAYALAARVEFPIGAAYFVPTQLVLVPMFVVAPAALVPVLVFAGYVIAALAAAATGRAGVDRVAFCAGDSVHALGPAIVISALAGGDAVTASAAVLVLALAAQFVADLVSSSVHEILAMGARPRVHMSMLLRVWGVDVAFGAIGLLAAIVAVSEPWVALAPVPLVVLMMGLAADRVRTIAAAQERLRALESERAKRHAASEMLERQDHFLQDVSHELRTPVTIARGHLELLERSGGETPETVVVRDELGRIERIVERLLLIARAEHAEAIGREPLDLEAFLEDCFVRWSDAIPRPWKLGDLAVASVDADVDALRAALDALLENAVKHTNAAQAITLSSRSEGEEVVVEVADEGSGIPAEALAGIFDRFARADPGRSRQAGGAGLGLAMVAAVAKAHGGTCSVESSAAGSTFSLRMPV
jgi:signal transduction histidine kinase